MLVGCPDPSPTYTRFFDPQRNRLSTDLDEIGQAYIGSLAVELSQWLDRLGPREPIGVLFSGGVDSGAVLLTLYHLLLQRGETPQRLKAFTLDVGGRGGDALQAQQFLDELDLGYLLERFDVPVSAISVDAAIKVLEDYKPLDVQSAAMVPGFVPGYPRPLSRLEVAGRRRWWGRKPEGLSDPRKRGTDDPQCAE